MTQSFFQLCNSRTKLLQAYIESILMHNKREDFVRNVWIRAWRFWETQESKKESGIEDRDILHKVYFDKVKRHLDAHFTEMEMAIILSEKKRLADIRRAEKRAKLEEQHEQELIRQKIRNLRYIEIRVMLGMGYSSYAIEQELGLSKRQIKDTLLYQEKKKKDKEINYMLEVLEMIQEITAVKAMAMNGLSEATFCRKVKEYETREG